jgi:hypothetical protein
MADAIETDPQALDAGLRQIEKQLSNLLNLTRSPSP